MRTILDVGGDGPLSEHAEVLRERDAVRLLVSAALAQLKKAIKVVGDRRKEMPLEEVRDLLIDLKAAKASATNAMGKLMADYAEACCTELDKREGIGDA